MTNHLDVHDVPGIDVPTIDVAAIDVADLDLPGSDAADLDLLYYQFGAGSTLGATINHAANRLPYLAALLADVAWTHGETAAHDGALPVPAPEAEEVKRVFRHHANVKRRAIMNPEQRTAVVAYLDALLIEVTSCLDLDEHAPSATLGREARRFVGDFREVREAAAAL